MDITLPGVVESTGMHGLNLGQIVAMKGNTITTMESGLDLDELVNGAAGEGVDGSQHPVGCGSIIPGRGGGGGLTAVSEGIGCGLAARVAGLESGDYDAGWSGPWPVTVDDPGAEGRYPLFDGKPVGLIVGPGTHLVMDFGLNHTRKEMAAGIGQFRIQHGHPVGYDLADDGGLR